jgi:hypothetical protein
MSELEQIKSKKEYIIIGGKEREIKFGMAAFAKVEELYGDLAEMGTAMTAKPFTVLPKVILYAIKDREGLTEENMAEMLDENYNINDLKDMLTSAISSSMPTAKKGKGNPPKAE